MIEIIILVILLLLSAFFSSVETATMSVSMIKVRTFVRQKRKGSDALFRLKQNPRRLLITILIGNNLVNIAAASLATIIITDMFGSAGIGIATGVMTLLVLVFGEITPKSFATQNAERMSLVVARPIELLGYAMYPVVRALEGLTSVVAGSRKQKKLTEDELRTIVTVGEEEGILNKEVADMMQSLLTFEKTRVRVIMTPRTEMATVNGDEKLRKVLDYVIKTPYSRYPVWEKHKEKITGILDVDDVLKAIKGGGLGDKVKTMARPVYFVPETKEIDELLSEFQRKSTPMIVVVDEYGGVAGLVTIEDVLEEIVGDIFDKSLKPGISIKPVGEGVIRADARASIEHVDEFLHLGLKEEHYDTIAGFIERKIGRVPRKGESIELKDVTIIIEDATPQRIKRVKIMKKGKLGNA